MRKMICAFGCVIALLLVGCQTQLDPSNTETNSNQTIEDSTPDPDSTSESDPTRTDAGSDGNDENNSAKNDNVSDDPDNAPTLPNEVGGNVDEIGEDDSGTYAVITDIQDHELKSEGSLRGEIEVTHKLTCGTMTLDEGDSVIFSLDTSLASAELKITLTGAQTGTILDGFVTGSGEMSRFEIETADEYSVMVENCGQSAVQFTIDYSIGGSK